MNRTIAAIFILCICATALAQPATQPAAAPPGIAVAVLDFEAANPNIPDLGKTISETVTIMLSGEPGIRMVDRSSLSKILQEQQLNLTGLVDTEQAVKVGKLVGAKIMVVGRAFELDSSVYITAKMIGTETSLVDGVLVKADASDGIGGLVMELSQKLGERLREKGQGLVAGAGPVDSLIALKQSLAGRGMPTVVVVIPERHITPRPPAPDPAAQTEITLMLKECGVTIKDVKSDVVAQWVSGRNQTPPATLPAELRGVDLVISGEAFSEAAARLGNLHSATARLEVSMIDTDTGEIVLADRQTMRAVDLSENIAAKTALQKTGRASALRILEQLVRTTEPR